MDLVHREAARFLREQRVGRGARVLVAVSGGADSVALLHALLALGQRVEAAHVHHGLRGADADADLAFVAQLSHALGVPFSEAHVAAAERDGRSPEARARELRYRALEQLRVRRGCAHIATAHHRDDQAETLLLRAVRGTGLAGLASIRPSLDGGRVLRPVLALPRAELRRYLAERGLAFREDASNRELAIPRNRLRAEVLPALESIQPGAGARLAALAALAARADDARAAELEPRLAAGLELADGGAWLDHSQLAGLGVPQRARLLRAWAERAGLAGELSRVHVERIESFLAASRSGQTLSLPRGFALQRERTRIWLGAAPGPRVPETLCVELPGDGALEFPERGLRLSWHACTAPDPPAHLLRLPAGPSESLVARSPAPGDRVRASGRERRLKDLFASARWERVARARAVVVERGGEIVWIPGLWRGESGSEPGYARELRAVRLPSP